jgi:hypothetical protein
MLPKRPGKPLTKATGADELCTATVPDVSRIRLSPIGNTGNRYEALVHL